MEFQSLLLQVGQALNRDEVQALAFLCTELLDKDLSSVSSASQLFSLLTDQDLLSAEQPYLLADLLHTIERHSLTREHGLKDKRSTTRGLISPYRKLLYDLSENITEEELKNIKFLLSNHLPRKKLEQSVTALEVFLEMEHKDLLSNAKLDLLENIVGSCCPILKKKINEFKTNRGPITEETREGILRSKSASDVFQENQDAFLLPKRPLSCGEAGFKQYGNSNELLIPPSYFSTSAPPSAESSHSLCLPQSLNASLDVARDPDTSDEGLSPRLRLLRINGDSSAVLTQEHSRQVSCVSSPGDENTHPAEPQTGNTKEKGLGEYAMTGRERGLCLIINNHNFEMSENKLNNRDGTDVDEKSLVSVFQWLGFVIKSERDCTRERILCLLKELGSKDSSQMDCVVVCVLSHGLEGSVYGVDGHVVSLKEITEPFTGMKCSSLKEKPKLFFIQACQGNREQQGVPIQSDSPGLSFPNSSTHSTTHSDAMVPRDTIPSGADFLLGMATVPHYASFRDKKKGTWFIQSLCQNLCNLVPSGLDLLSILTKVNDDVSRKTDSYGIKKQMPQPAFSLRKKVVFPIPKGPPPSLC